MRGIAYLFVELLLVLGLTASAWAQGESAIHGTVVASDGSALPGAEVVLHGGPLPEPLRTTAGPDGHFGFQRLVPGEYELIISRESFQTSRFRLTLRPREVQNVTLELPLSPVEQSLEVSAEAYLIPTLHSPGSTLLSPNRMTSLPLPQRTNLPEAILTSSPGMIRGHDDFVHIRGQEIALNPFINGVSFWENTHSVFSAGLGVDYIESMNVMTGGFAAEYGNRFGGVLDVVTKSGFTMDNGGSVTLGLGTSLRHNLSMEYGGHTE
ncbi:MAG TPA: carboxypeptidase regulatory-like domain-containing protein, partial [Terriglobia bacterium]|nr:carboxypeptidase regulatory-like domain-containing protein [Terriglobia bacterium]